MRHWIALVLISALTGCHSESVYHDSLWQSSGSVEFEGVKHPAFFRIENLNKAGHKVTITTLQRELKNQQQSPAPPERGWAYDDSTEKDWYETDIIDCQKKTYGRLRAWVLAGDWGDQDLIYTWPVPYEPETEYSPDSADQPFDPEHPAFKAFKAACQSLKANGN